MKYMLFFLVSISAYGQKLLKAGVYNDLKPKEALVLDTGTFTFIGCAFSPSPLEWPGVRLDCRKAKSITLVNWSVVGKKGQLKNRVLGKKVEFYHNQLSK